MKYFCKSPEYLSAHDVLGHHIQIILQIAIKNSRTSNSSS